MLFALLLSHTLILICHGALGLLRRPFEDRFWARCSLLAFPFSAGSQDSGGRERLLGWGKTISISIFRVLS
jgi:hypothetical protein